MQAPTVIPSLSALALLASFSFSSSLLLFLGFALFAQSWTIFGLALLSHILNLLFLNLVELPYMQVLYEKRVCTLFFFPLLRFSLTRVLFRFVFSSSSLLLSLSFFREKLLLFLVLSNKSCPSKKN
jgi:hypothetical protein